MEKSVLKYRRIGKITVSIVLAMAVYSRSLFFDILPANAEGAYSLFDLFVISEKEENAFVGEFAYDSGNVYVSEGTLVRMGDIESGIAVDTENVAFFLDRGGLESTFAKDEVLMIDDEVFYPMTKALGEMCLRATFVEEDRVLIIEQRADLSELETLMNEIYDNRTYNMGYWDKRDVSYNLSVAADIIKNWNFISYISGKEQTTQYQQAFWDILLPNNEDDLIIMADETDKLLGTLDKYADLGGDLYQRLTSEDKSGFLGDYGTVLSYTKKAADYMQFSEMVSLGNYLRNMDGINESYVRGLDLILNDSDLNMNDEMYNAGAYTLSVYRKQTPVGEAAMVILLEGGSKDIEKYLTKEVGKFVGVDNVVVTVVNELDNSILNTQEKIDSSLGALYRLNIQSECREYYRLNRQGLGGATWTEKQKLLQQLYDVMGLYLRCGVSAYRSVMVDTELEVASKISISMLNDRLKQLALYQEADFSCTKDTAVAEEKVEDFFVALPMEDRLGISAPAKVFSIEFKWDGKDWDGMSSDLSMDIEGVLDDGSSISASEKDEMVYGSDGKSVLQVERWEDDNSRSIKILFHCTDGIYQITLGDEESMELYQDRVGISRAEVQVTITDMNAEIMQFHGSEFLHRSYTGFYALGICVDHGELGEYHADWMDVDAPIDW